MFRSPLEKQIAKLRFVDGNTYEAIGRVVNRDRRNVARACLVITTCLRQIGVNVDSPTETSSAVIAILRRSGTAA